MFSSRRQVWAERFKSWLDEQAGGEVAARLYRLTANAHRHHLLTLSVVQAV